MALFCAIFGAHIAGSGCAYRSGSRAKSPTSVAHCSLAQAAFVFDEHRLEIVRYNFDLEVASLRWLFAKLVR